MNSPKIKGTISDSHPPTSSRLRARCGVSVASGSMYGLWSPSARVCSLVPPHSLGDIYFTALVLSLFICELGI